MRDLIEKLQLEAQEQLKKAASQEEILKIKTQFLGRKGKITGLLKQISGLSPEERPVIGQLINKVKFFLEDNIDKFLKELEKRRAEEQIFQESLDMTLPGRRVKMGAKHPVIEVLEEITAIFSSLGFQVVEGPEAESDYYNFEALNLPKEHPARDMHDTFYISENILLRTHTSPVQIRVMETCSPPLRIIAPGKVYRCDSDISHTPMFHQVEGLMVDKNITFADLKGVLTLFTHQVFGKDTQLRFRASFFPFTEPSAEIDIQCQICQGKGCRICSGSGWLEILGAGMVHPEVFKKVNYDPEEVSGFAFGIGIERIAMLKFGIDDIRLFFENDLRFLQQF